MNIVAKTAEGNIVVRPDTTWEKDNEDFYPPEFVDEISFSPVLFARVLKPGRSVGRKFASRYYDAVNYGVLLYPENLVDGSSESYAQAICLDHTSFLSTPMSSPSDLAKDGFMVMKDGNEVFSCGPQSLDLIEEAIAQATRFVYIRTGDLIAVELSPRRKLLSRSDGQAEVTGFWNGNRPLDFKISF